MGFVVKAFELLLRRAIRQRVDCMVLDSRRCFEFGGGP
jgi:hypothetical protein